MKKTYYGCDNPGCNAQTFKPSDEPLWQTIGFDSGEELGTSLKITRGKVTKVICKEDEDKHFCGNRCFCEYLDKLFDPPEKKVGP
jgi:hypothetical protein